VTRPAQASPKVTPEIEVSRSIRFGGRPSCTDLSTSIARFDAEIARLTDKLPDYALFEALPGAGPTLAPRLMAAFGERRERFAGASAAQKCFGIAHVIEPAVTSRECTRYGCSKFLRQTFVEWAAQTIPRSFRAKAFYESCRARGTRIRPHFALWPSNGSASCIAVGSTASPTTSRTT
jgi:hypothetical protein